MTQPYYADDHVTLYHGDWREHSWPVDQRRDVIITDPPYGETSLKWDRWPAGWPMAAEQIANTMWCFGSFRMFMDNRDEFQGWKFSHEIIWAKDRGTSLATDKFARAHELAVLWYRGPWADQQHNVPRVPSTQPNRGTRVHGAVPHMGQYITGTWKDDGTRMQTTILSVKHELRRAIHPTQKPRGVVTPLIEYSVPHGGTVVDIFAGSGTVALAARQAGRKCISFEINEQYCEAAAKRLAQQDLDFGDWNGAV